MKNLVMVIYKMEFPNGKLYIGKSKNFEDRKKSHLYNTKYRKTKLINAINKYGYDSIIWTILFETDDMNILNQREREFINYYDSIKNGYNTTIGGDGGDTISNNIRRSEIIKQQLSSKGFNPDKYIEIDDEISKNIILDYVDNKMSIRAIVKKYSISKNRVTRFIKSNNINIDVNRITLTNTKTFDDDYIIKIVNMYKNGLTIKDIANSENITILLVSRILHDSGHRLSKRFVNGRRYDGQKIICEFNNFLF